MFNQVLQIFILETNLSNILILQIPVKYLVLGKGRISAGVKLDGMVERAGTNLCPTVNFIVHAGRAQCASLLQFLSVSIRSVIILWQHLALVASNVNNAHFGFPIQQSLLHYK